MKPFDLLAISQINRRLRHLRSLSTHAQVHPGWIRYMRQALHMTLKTLAEKAGVSLPTVAQAERGEAAGKINLSTLKAMAEAMDCEFIYAFVPKVGVDELMKKAALEKAKRILGSVDTHMTLEDQRVELPLEERLERLAKKLYEGGDVW